jgi:hypothetical protein
MFVTTEFNIQAAKWYDQGRQLSATNATAYVLSERTTANSKAPVF